jgi:hypothetical protein
MGEPLSTCNGTPESLLCAPVYGRYHCAADAAAGTSVAVFAVGLSAVLQGTRHWLAVTHPGASPSASVDMPVAIPVNLSPAKASRPLRFNRFPMFYDWREICFLMFGSPWPNR